MSRNDAPIQLTQNPPGHKPRGSSFLRRYPQGFMLRGPSLVAAEESAGSADLLRGFQLLRPLTNQLLQMMAMLLQFGLGPLERATPRPRCRVDSPGAGWRCPEACSSPRFTLRSLSIRAIDVASYEPRPGSGRMPTAANPVRVRPSPWHRRKWSGRLRPARRFEPADWAD